MGPKEDELLEALEDWRECKMRDVHGEAHLINLGPATIMPDDVLDRIVDCAHFFKIKTVDDLSRETRWSKAHKFGVEVIAIVHRMLPIPIVPHVLTSVPLQPHQASQPGTPSSLPNALTAISLPDETITPSSSITAVKKNRCSACGSEGHNSEFCLASSYASSHKVLIYGIPERNRVCLKHPLHNAAPSSEKENLNVSP